MPAATPPRILVAGIGNVFRTDDGFGCEVVRRLAAEPLPDGVRAVDYGIRGLHLTYDLLDPWGALVIVDALPDRGDVGAVAVVRVGPDDVATGARVDAHGMDPATVLASLAALGGSLPGRTLVVGCQVADTGEGMGLTAPVAAAVDDAVRAVHTLVTRDLARAEVT